jgi:hypothetical protein
MFYDRLVRIAGRALGLVLLGGCTQLLGLDDVETSDRDLDADGVLDSEDNCRGTRNPDQLDTDGDNVGDACDTLICEVPGTSINRDVDRDGVDDGCDPCLLGFNDDEDGDGIFDPCDRCPGVADPDQADKDGDGIGDGCDRVDFSETPTQRVFFDGFGAGPHDWIDPAWRIDDGTLSILSPGLDASVANAALFGTDWTVAMSVTLPIQASANERLSLIVRDAFGTTRSCSIVFLAGKGFTLESLSSGASDSAMLDPGTTVLLQMYPSSKTAWNCDAGEWGSAPAPSDDVGAQAQKLRVGGTMPEALIRYIDVTR